MLIQFMLTLLMGKSHWLDLFEGRYGNSACLYICVCVCTHMCLPRDFWLTVSLK